jgi:hypothetical protein
MTEKNPRKVVGTSSLPTRPRSVKKSTRTTTTIRIPSTAGTRKAHLVSKRFDWRFQDTLLRAMAMASDSKKNLVTNLGADVERAEMSRQAQVWFDQSIFKDVGDLADLDEGEEEDDEQEESEDEDEDEDMDSDVEMAEADVSFDARFSPRHTQADPLASHFPATDRWLGTWRGRFRGRASARG